MVIIAWLQIHSIDKKKGDLKEGLAEVNEKINNMMEKKLDYNRLKRKVDSYNDMVALLEQKNQEASIRIAEKPEEVTVVKPALLPRSPVNPPKTVATGAIGIIMGLILGLVLGFVLETFDTSLAAIEDVEETLGTQVLGIVVHGDVKTIEAAVKEKDEKDGDQGENSLSPFRRSMHLVSHFAPRSVLAESFRALRTNIQFRGVEKNIKTLAITSTSPQEGKTTVACNLAIAMAQAGRRTLLVESDLRKPGISKAFGIEISPGLTDVLLGNYSFGDVVKTVTDIIVGKMNLNDVMFTPGLDNLHIVTCGTMPPNPAELIGSNQLEEFVEEVKRDYDVVILDTPPVLSAADAAILGTKSDAVLLIYRVGSVSRGLLKRSAVQLSQAKCNIIGVVLNDMKAAVSPDFQGFKYYQYYYSYRERGEEEEKKERWKGLWKGLRKGLRKGLLSYIDKIRPKIEAAKKTGESDRARSRSKGIAEKLKVASSKSILLLIALVSLTGGLLWQNGFLSGGTHASKKQPPVKESEGALSETRPLSRVRRPISPPDTGSTVPSAAHEATKKALPKTKLLASVKPSVSASGSVNVKMVPSSPHDPSGTDLDLSQATAHATTVRYPYSLRIASFRRFGAVEKAIEALKDKGLSPYWTHIDLGLKGRWFAIYVGHFATSGEADKLRKQYALTRSLISKTPHAVEIGKHSSDKVLSHKNATLKKMGGSPYSIETAQGGHGLLIGAFITQRAARELAQRLTEAGIDCTAVLR
jgi:Mrp family chromosome partitioning ATPase